MQSMFSLLAQRIAAFSRDDRGSIAILFAASLVVLVGIAGGAIDLNRATRVKGEMQAALDAAVLAAASASKPDMARATVTFEQNFTSGDAINVTPSFSTGSDGSVVGSATAEVPTTLMGVLAIKSLPIDAHSEAVGSKGSAAAPCVIALSKTKTQSLLVNSKAQVEASCEIHVHSKASPAAIFNSGSTINAKGICIAGTDVKENGGTHSTVSLGCVPQADPYAGKFTEPDSAKCTYKDLNFNGGTPELHPGVYCGSINFNGAPSVKFNPGTYVIKDGGWNVNGGKWTGTDVNFFFADKSKIQFNSNVDVTITPPTTGPNSGVILFEKSGLSESDFVLNDAKGMKLEGIIYLPSRNVTFNSGSQLVAIKRTMSIVVNSFIFNETYVNLGPYSPSGSSAVSNVRLVK